LEDKLSRRAPLGLSKIELRSNSELRNAFARKSTLPSTLAFLAREARRLLCDLGDLVEADRGTFAGIEAALAECSTLIDSLGE
jgi:hypothetical protein